MRDFRRLKVWERAHNLTLALYKATEHFPKEESYGLKSQLRRSCSSIGANISEGCGREGVNEFARFLIFAMGSASELENHLLLARDLHFLPDPIYQQLAAGVIEVKRMLTSLVQKLRADR